MVILKKKVSHIEFDDFPCINLEIWKITFFNMENFVDFHKYILFFKNNSVEIYVREEQQCCVTAKKIWKKIGDSLLFNVGKS